MPRINIITTKDPLVAAWEAADALLRSNSWDAYSQNSANRLYGKADCPDWRKQRCNDIEAWITRVWTEYGRCKATIAAGYPATYNPDAPGPCPWTVWQIASETP